MKPLFHKRIIKRIHYNGQCRIAIHTHVTLKKKLHNNSILIAQMNIIFSIKKYIHNAIYIHKLHKQNRFKNLKHPYKDVITYFVSNIVCFVNLTVKYYYTSTYIS